MGIMNDDSFWLGDYNASSVRFFDSDGNNISDKTISYGSGQGPGEFQNPRYIIPLEDQNRLIITCKFGKTISFDLSTGKFKEKLINFLPFGASLKFNENSFAFIWAKNPGSSYKEGVFFFNAKGDITEFWEAPQPRWQKEYIYDVPRGYAIDANKNIYIGHGGRHEIMVLEHKNAEYKIWNIKLPRGYEPPPKKNLSRDAMIHSEKLNAYFNGFSFIDNLFTISEHYLLVVWNNRKPLSISLDIYDLRKKERIIGNFKIPGHVVGVGVNSIFVHELVENDDFEEDETRIIVYEFSR